MMVHNRYKRRMFDWDDHRLVLSLHRHGTLRATGEALDVTHTTVARRLAALADREPTPLFTRRNRAYVATEYGLERVAIAERMEALHASATRLRRSSGDGLSGPLSLSIPLAVYKHVLLDTIQEFVARYPAIQLTVVGTDRLADLDRGEADVVIRGHASPPDHLIGRKLCTVAISDYAHKDYFAQTSPENRHWIAADWSAEWIAESAYPDYPVGVVIHDIQSRFLALESGQGLARAACFMADAHPDLVRIDDRPPTPIYGLWALTHPDLRGSPKVRALMAALSDKLIASRTLIQGDRIDGLSG